MKKLLSFLLAVFIIVIFAPSSFSAKPIKKPVKTIKSDVKVVLPPKPTAFIRGWLAKAGLAGGAGVVELGYLFSPNNKIELNMDAGYGIGKNYYLLMLEGTLLYKINPNYYTGLILDLINYSEKVRSIPLMSGTVDNGSSIGVGLLAGRDFGKWGLELGYNTALGLIARGRYNF